MLTTKEDGLLRGIIKHCVKINEKMDGLVREDLETNEDVLEIICFNILQIGELAKNFELDFCKKYNGVPWSQIKGMRDRVAHGYGVINKDIVWDTASTNITPLLVYCRWIIEYNNKADIK